MRRRKIVLANVQVLRFCAAALVLFTHIQNEARELGGYTPWNPIFWGIGVDIFFVISGFIMFYLAGEKYGQSGFSYEFLKRRIMRVVPLYWLFTAGMIASILMFSDRITYNHLDSNNIVSSFLFLPRPRLDGRIRPLLSLGWTLNYEILFYLLFAISLLFRRKIGLPGLLGALVVAAWLHFLMPASWIMIGFWTDPIILLFGIGIGIGLMRERRVSFGPSVAVMLTAAGAGILWLTNQFASELADTPRFFQTVLPATLISVGCLLLDCDFSEGKLKKAAIELGNASYALYLSHPFSLNALAVIWKRQDVLGSAAFVPIGWIIATIVAIVVYNVVERPLLGWMSQRAEPPNITRLS